MGEPDDAPGVDDEHRRMRQQVVRLARVGLEIDAVTVLVGRHQRLLDAERDPEGAHRLRLAVGQQGVAESGGRGLRTQLFGSVRAQGDELESRRPQIALDLAEGGEVPRAIRTPAAAVEDQHRRAPAERRAQVRRLARHRAHRRRRHRRTDRERLCGEGGHPQEQ